MRLLLNIAQLSLRAVHSAELLRTVNLTQIIKCRYATRWVSRRPVAIVNEDEVFNADDTEKDSSKMQKKVEKVSQTRGKRSKRSKLKKKIVAKQEETSENEIEGDAMAGPKYISLKADDKIISSLMIDIKTKKKREQNNKILLEGFRLIKDAIEAGSIPQVIFFSRLCDIEPLSLPRQVQLYKVPYRTIQLWSNLTTSPGVLGIFEIPDIDNKKPPYNAIPLTIICDNVREPGNLGAIVRAAAAVGCEKLLLMKGCVDLWEPKVLRAAVGAHFRLPIATSLTWDEIPALISNESAIFLADNDITHENKLDNHMVNPETDTSISMENDNSDMKLEDLNEKNDEITSDVIDQLTNQTKANKPTAKTRSLVKKLISRLPVEPYYMLDYTQKEAVLVIGGETEGINLESCKLLHERNCVRINVPLTNEVESLNIGVAIGIVTFEMRRQFITRRIEDE